MTLSVKLTRIRGGSEFWKNCLKESGVLKYVPRFPHRVTF